VFSVRLVDESSRTSVSLVDVGFGISQVLPVIVQSMLSKESTILVEQPEIHLHPRLQAELGTLFAECIKAPNRNQFIIETHSEHLILRLQRLIRRGDLEPNQVSVLYVGRAPGDESFGSVVQQLEIDDDGDFITQWPDGFFDESLEEMFGR
jgi:predicted ATPase